MKVFLILEHLHYIPVPQGNKRKVQREREGERERITGRESCVGSQRPSSTTSHFTHEIDSLAKKNRPCRRKRLTVSALFLSRLHGSIVVQWGKVSQSCRRARSGFQLCLSCAMSTWASLLLSFGSPASTFSKIKESC